MKTISGKSRSSARPSPLSSSRLITTGVDVLCADHEKGLPAAFGLASSVPPQWNSRSGSTSSKGATGKLQVGSLPVPTHSPPSQVVNSGQSQSSSQLQPEASGFESSQLLV